MTCFTSLKFGDQLHMAAAEGDIHGHLKQRAPNVVAVERRSGDLVELGRADLSVIRRDEVHGNTGILPFWVLWVGLVALALAVPSNLSAQQVSLGLRAGANVSEHAGDFEETTIEPGFRPGAELGLLAFVRITDRFDLQGEIDWVQKGTEWEVPPPETAEGTIKVRQEYLQIPLLARFTFPTQGASTLHLFGGPRVAIETSCESAFHIEGRESPRSCEQTFEGSKEEVEYGLLLGAGVGFDVGAFPVVFEARYDRGVTSIIDPGFDRNINNQTLSVSLSVVWPAITG